MKQPLSNIQLIELAKKAFEDGEMAEFLSGVGDYENPVHRFVPANVPTDVRRSIEQGIYKFYQFAPNHEIIDSYKNGIVQLLNGSPLQVWLGYRACWSQLYKEKNGKAPFKIMSPDFVADVKKALIKNQRELSLIFEWQGVNEEQGLWSDIVRVDGNLRETFEVSFL